MSPATLNEDDETEIAPLETTSPITDRVPPPLSEIALPLAPPHPAWVKAAPVGMERRLLTFPVAVPLMVGVDPLGRMRANRSCGDRAALSANSLPWGPATVTAGG